MGHHEAPEKCYQYCSWGGAPGVYLTTRLHIFEKNINGDKKKHAKKIQVLIADLKSARKNTI